MSFKSKKEMTSVEKVYLMSLMPSDTYREEQEKCKKKIRKSKFIFTFDVYFVGNINKLTKH
jgi:hypothetical protein